ncbi:MAG: hypothetical protein AABW59_01660 [archaeon]
MTFNNSILLIIKQNKGLEYNELFARIMPQYKNAASARSALARSLKDMISFGLVKKEGSRIFITDKGIASINVEMKDKLIFRLNEEMKNPLKSLDEIVRLLVVLSQRSSQDPDLLKSAKEHATFTINDINEARKRIREKRKSLKRMSLLLDTQSESLKNLDFNDSVEENLDENLIAKIRAYVGKEKVIAEIRDEQVLSKVPDLWKKQSIVTVEGPSLDLLLQLLSNYLYVKATLYLPGVKVVLQSGKATCFGSYKTLKSFSELKIENIEGVEEAKEESKLDIAKSNASNPGATEKK